MTIQQIIDAIANNVSVSNDQIIDALTASNQAGETIPINDLETILDSRSAHINGTDYALLYSGAIDPENVSLVRSEQVAVKIADESAGKVAVLNNTEAGALHFDDSFRDAVRRTAGDNTYQSLGNDLSARYVHEAGVPIRTVTPLAVDGRTFSAVETAALIEEMRAGNIPSVDGIPASSLLQSYDHIVSSGGSTSDATLHIQRQISTKSLVDTAQIKYVSDAADVTHIDTTKYWGISSGVTPSTIAEGTPNQSSLSSFYRSLDDVQWGKVAEGAKSLKDAGVVGDMLGIIIMGHDAGAAIEAGNTVEAAHIISSWLAETLAGIGAGIVTTVALTPYVTPLLAFGPPGAIAAAGLIGVSALLTSLGAGAVAKAAVDDLYEFGKSLALIDEAPLAGLQWHDFIIGSALDNLPSEFQQLLGQFDLIRTIRDPLVVDLNGDGRATVVDSHVYFDLDSDGAFSEAVHLWAAPQDGMIVVDLNNNGRADSGAELFSDVSAWNALRAYDLNGDHVINVSDAVWTQLHVWQDKNADGATQADEWFSMDALGISAITPPSVGETGSITTASGTSVVTAYNFTTDTRNTIYTGDTEVDFTTLFLPALRGYATLPDLRAAMSLDNTGTDSLLNNVATLAGKSLSDIAENLVAFRADFLEMMYQWAGVDAISPTSRGDYLTDARKLEFLEEYFGVNFLQARFREANPLSVAGTMVENVFDAVADAVSPEIANDNVSEFSDSYLAKAA